MDLHLLRLDGDTTDLRPVIRPLLQHPILAFSAILVDKVANAHSDCRSQDGASHSASINRLRRLRWRRRRRRRRGRRLRHHLIERGKRTETSVGEADQLRGVVCDLGLNAEPVSGPGSQTLIKDGTAVEQSVALWDHVFGRRLQMEHHTQRGRGQACTANWRPTCQKVYYLHTGPVIEHVVDAKTCGRPEVRIHLVPHELPDIHRRTARGLQSPGAPCSNDGPWHGESRHADVATARKIGLGNLQICTVAKLPGRNKLCRALLPWT
mmetsp:Transcript_57024/g.102467  ORF Transcript_57024/g.102467 Transcript_57024/m.102467 type:complete len:266 (-) Transcript_57024:1440-2237(-)